MSVEDLIKEASYDHYSSFKKIMSSLIYEISKKIKSFHELLRNDIIWMFSIHNKSIRINKSMIMLWEKKEKQFEHIWFDIQ
jgi:hypothetical protein